MVTTTQGKRICQVCGYIYDPAKGDGGIYPLTDFENLPDTWCCPDCGATKSQFDMMEEN